MPDGRWFDCLPSCETEVPCGQGSHRVRWEAGSLRLPEHPDTEAELVLAALGGEKADCVAVAEAWERHTSDLSVLAIGTRGPDDEIWIGWDDVAAAAQIGQTHRTGPRAGPGRFRPQAASARAAVQSAQHGPMPTAVPPRTQTAVAARRQQAQRELERSWQRRNDMVCLLALGYGFQVRLAGQVAAAHAGAVDGQGDDAAAASRVRPALTAAMAGRLAPVAADWIGIDVDQVTVSLHRGPGWGAAELDRGRLRISLPAWWLARVWACGLALAGGHLVVAVERAGWPRAGVRGLRVPGAEPEPLNVHAAEGGAGPGGVCDVPHWEV